MFIKRITLLFAALFMAGIILGDTNNTEKANSYYEEIKFEFINNKIIIPVTIDGNEYRFLFDTGAPNIISKELFENINPEVLKTTKTTDATGKSNDLKIVMIPDIILGETPFRNTKALSYDLKKIDIFNCYNIDGFIGSNLLKNSIVQIDIKNKTLIITNNKHSLDLDKSKAVKMEVLGEQKSPYIFIELKGEKTARDQVMIDTGMDGFYDISHRSYDIFKNNNILKDIGTAKGGNITSLFGNAEESEQHRILIDKIIVANTSFLKFVTITSNDNISRIGTELFKYGVTTIDFKNKHFYFDTNEETINISKPLPGFTPAIADGHLAVGFVWDSELSDKISYGDEIIKINDLDIEKMSFCELIRQRNLIAKKDTLNMEFKTKSGDITKLTIIKKFPAQ